MKLSLLSQSTKNGRGWEVAKDKNVFIVGERDINYLRDNMIAYAARKRHYYNY